MERLQLLKSESIATGKKSCAIRKKCTRKNSEIQQALCAQKSFRSSSCLQRLSSNIKRRWIQTDSLCVFSFLKITKCDKKLADFGLLAQTALNRATNKTISSSCVPAATREAFDYCFAHNRRPRSSLRRKLQASKYMSQNRQQFIVAAFVRALVVCVH
jgi:hypothetical protein